MDVEGLLEGASEGFNEGAMDTDGTSDGDPDGALDGDADNVGCRFYLFLLDESSMFRPFCLFHNVVTGTIT